MAGLTSEAILALVDEEGKIRLEDQTYFIEIERRYGCYFWNRGRKDGLSGQSIERKE